MDLSVQKTDVLSYDVKDAGYWTHVSVPMTKDGYGRLRKTFERNVSIAMVLVDTEHFERFLSDWISAVKVFARSGALTAGEATAEIEEIQGYPERTLSRLSDVVKAGLDFLARKVFSPGDAP